MANTTHTSHTGETRAVYPSVVLLHLMNAWPRYLETENVTVVAT